jgi:hypothetical protein
MDFRDHQSPIGQIPNVRNEPERSSTGAQYHHDPIRVIKFKCFDKIGKEDPTKFLVASVRGCQKVLLIGEVCLGFSEGVEQGL